MKKFIFIFALIICFKNSFSQESYSKGYSFKRMEVEKTKDYTGSDVLTLSDINTLNLIEKMAGYYTNSNNSTSHDYSGYNYYGWSEKIRNSRTLTNGTIESNIENHSGISLVIRTEPQWLELTFINSSSLYCIIDVSDVSIDILTKNSDGIWVNSINDTKLYNILFNINRGHYDNVILSPYSKYTCSYFDIRVQSNNTYDIIDDSAINGSEARFNFNCKFFLNNPLNDVTIPQVTNKKYQYSQYTPTPVYLNYKGGYFKNEFGAIIIHNDYASKFENCDINCNIKLVLEVKKSIQTYPIVKNKFGFNRFK